MDNNFISLISYKTVKKECSAEFTEKKSVFIGHVKPVWDEKSALDFINQTRGKYSDASHNVYAYIIRDTNIIRFSDDGEPNSTAGVPALSVLQKNDLTNVAAVVTRYFGGILLGAGGLVRAYSHAVKLAVEAAGIALYETFTEFDVLCGYSEYDRLLKFIKSEKIIIDNTSFGENIILSLAIKSGRFDKIRADIINLSNGKSDIIKKGERYSSENIF